MMVYLAVLAEYMAVMDGWAKTDGQTKLYGNFDI